MTLTTGGWGNWYHGTNIFINRETILHKKLTKKHQEGENFINVLYISFQQTYTFQRDERLSYKHLRSICVCFLNDAYIFDKAL